MNESSGRGVFRKDFPGGLDLLTGLATVVIVLAAIQLVVGALDVGVTTDEPTHTDRTQSLIDYGWFLPESFLLDGQPALRRIATPYVYGPGFSLPAHLLASIFGIESFGVVSEVPSAWQFRHLMVAAVALLTACAVWASARALTGSRRMALWSVAALLCIPIWLGMGMFNVKDLPVAAGYTMFTAGLILSLGARGSQNGIRLGTIGLFCASGVVLAFGVRFALWAALGASLLTWLTIWLLRKRSAAGCDQRGPIAVAAGCLVGLALTALSYPAVFTDPIGLLFGAIRDSSDFPYDASTLTAGTSLSARSLPPWYLPLWVFAVVPVGIGLLAAFGFLAWIGSLITSIRASRFTEFMTGPRALAVLVVVQLLLLPTAAVVSGATMYSGMRQHLLVIPPIAIFAGYGLASVARSRWFVTVGKSRRQGMLAVLAALALTVPFLEQTRLFPYNYTYINPVAGIGGINGRWEGDFWWASGREAVEHANTGDSVACTQQLAPPVFSSCEKNWVLQYLPPGVEPFSPGTSSGEWVRVLGGRLQGEDDPPDFCRLDKMVTRPLRLERVEMSWTYLCDSRQVAARFQAQE